MEPLELFRLVATEFSEVEDEEVEKWMELAKPSFCKQRHLLFQKGVYLFGVVVNAITHKRAGRNILRPLTQSTL